MTPDHAPLGGLVVVGHGGRVPGDELAVVALAIVLVLVCLSGLRRRHSRASPPNGSQAHTDSDAEHTPTRDPE